MKALITGASSGLGRDFAYKLGTFGYFDYSFYQIFAATIVGMCLSGKYKLNGLRLVAYYFGKPIEVCKYQIGTFIGCKTSGKTYCQCFGVEFFYRIQPQFWILGTSEKLCLKPLLHMMQQLLFLLQMGMP